METCGYWTALFGGRDDFHDIKIVSLLLVICEWDSLVIGEFPLQGVSDAELWCFLWNESKQTVEK